MSRKCLHRRAGHDAVHDADAAVGWPRVADHSRVGVPCIAVCLGGRGRVADHSRVSSRSVYVVEPWEGDGVNTILLIFQNNVKCTTQLVCHK